MAYRSATTEISEVQATSGRRSVKGGGAEVTVRPTPGLGLDFGLQLAFPRRTRLIAGNYKYHEGVDRGGDGAAIYWVRLDPSIHTIRWDEADDRYDPNALKTLVFPYLEFFSVFTFERRWDNEPVTQLQNNSQLNAMYYSNTPLNGLKDALKMAALRNNSESLKELQGWMCMITSPNRLVKGWWDLQTLLEEHVDNQLAYFFSSGFNRSSEDHEQFSYWERTEEAGLISLAEWLAISQENPSRILTKPWLDIGMTPEKVLAILRQHHGGRLTDDARTRMVSTGNFLARIPKELRAPQEA